MVIGVPTETTSGETRVALTPDSVKKLLKKGFQVVVQSGAGDKAGFSDPDFEAAGARIESNPQTILQSSIVTKIHRPSAEEIQQLQANSTLLCLMEVHSAASSLEKLAQRRVNVLALELIPRTSRAQSMDVLSSQANIAGYRAVVEAATRYGRFMPMMMTSAGMAKPARVLILGAGVAGLQAIATAKRLGGAIEAFDVRAEVKEQIQSLGAKFVEIDLGEEGSGQGGYAKELSEEGKRKQLAALTEKIKKSDIVISTANIPGKRAPTLINEEAVTGMRRGSVIVDMAAANGGNCPLTVANEITYKNGVCLVGITNFPALVPTDASQFFGNNLVNLLSLTKPTDTKLEIDMNDDILAASFVVWDGSIRTKGKS